MRDWYTLAVLAAVALYVLLLREIRDELKRR